MDCTCDDHYQLYLDPGVPIRSSLQKGQSWIDYETVENSRFISAYGLQLNWRLFQEVCKPMRSYSLN